MKKFLLFLFLIPSLVGAQSMTVKSFLENKNDPRVARWVGAEGNAFNTFNAYLIPSKQNPFCPPTNIALNTENYMKILDDYLNVHPQDNPEEFPVAIVLLWALLDAFPCQ